MRYLFTNDADTKQIDKQITRVMDEMDAVQVDSNEYRKFMVRLDRLYKLKAQERREPMSRDTIAKIVGNLAGILLIVAYEQKHVITSKGFGEIIRLGRDS